MIEVTRQVFHGSDLMAQATIYWPQSNVRKACHFAVDIAADAFANREPWLLAFSPNEPILWVVRGHMGLGGGRRVNGKPLVARVHRVNLTRPDAIRTKLACGAGPVGIGPQRLVDAIEPHIQRRDEPEYEGQLVGHVFDPAGQPLANCTVSIAAANRTTPAIHPRLNCTSKHGTFALRKLSCEQPLQLTIRRGKQCTGLTAHVTPVHAAQTGQPTRELELGKAPDGTIWTLKIRNK